MIAATLSARDRRTLAIGVAAMGSIVALGRGLPALARWERGRVEAAAEARARLRDETVAARLLPALTDSLRARRARLDSLEGVLFVGTLPAEASAQLAAVLAEYAEAAQLKVVSVQMRQDTARAGAPLLRVGARLVGAGDVTALAGLLQAIETDESPLAVRELTVSQSEPAAPDTRPEILRLELFVEGLASLRRAAP